MGPEFTRLQAFVHKILLSMLKFYMSFIEVIQNNNLNILLMFIRVQFHHKSN